MLFAPIPQFDDRPASWGTFLHKAAKGSYQAAEWLDQADLAVAAQLGGRALVEEADSAECEQTLQDALPAAPPFDDVQALLDQARFARVVDTRLLAREQAFHQRAHYEGLWGRGTGVKPGQLLHDAAHDCLRRWDGPSFRERVDLARGGVSFNSQDVVAAMIYLLSGLSVDHRTGR